MDFRKYLFFIDSDKLYSPKPKVKRPSKLSRKFKGYLTLLFILSLIGLLVYFSVQVGSAKVYLDNPPAVKIAPVQVLEPISAPKLKQVSKLAIMLPKPSKAAYVRPVLSTGNQYDYRQCVWWAYERRAQLGNPVPGNWHSAYQWLGNAQAQGWPTGSTPKFGAVGVSGNHVVVIEKVSDSEVYLSEMNYDYNGSFRYRWANASDFYYIY